MRLVMTQSWEMSSGRTGPQAAPARPLAAAVTGPLMKSHTVNRMTQSTHAAREENTEDEHDDPGGGGGALPGLVLY